MSTLNQTKASVASRGSPTTIESPAPGSAGSPDVSAGYKSVANCTDVEREQMNYVEQKKRENPVVQVKSNHLRID